MPILDQRAFLVLILLLTMGCGTNNVTPEETYSIQGEVLDRGGDPMADVPISILFALDGSDADWPPEGLVLRTATFTDTLLQNHPNPAIDITWIAYRITRSSLCSLRILDGHDNLVRTLIDDQVVDFIGNHEIMWNLKDEAGDRIPNGLYRARLDLVQDDSMKRFISAPILVNNLTTYNAVPNVVSDAEGRFEIPYADLHVGSEIPFTTHSSTPEAWHTLPDSLWLQTNVSGDWTRFKVKLDATDANLPVILQLDRHPVKDEG
jgi:hypothetical protein